MINKQFYNEEYFKQLIKNKSLYQFLAVNLVPIIKTILEEKPFVKILEIGCGKANFISYLFDKNVLANDKCKVYLSDIVDQKVKYPFIENFEIIDAEEKMPYFNEFDLILALDLIEHIGNFKSFINNVHNALNKDGIFFFITPNVNSFKKFILGKEWCGYKDITHFQLFDKNLLERILLLYFKKVSIQGFTQIKSLILQHKVLSDYLLGICCK